VRYPPTGGWGGERNWVQPSDHQAGSNRPSISAESAGARVFTAGHPGDAARHYAPVSGRHSITRPAVIGQRTDLEPKYLGAGNGAQRMLRRASAPQADAGRAPLQLTRKNPSATPVETFGRRFAYALSKTVALICAPSSRQQR